MSRTERKFTPISELDGQTVEFGKKNKKMVVFDFHALPKFEDATSQDLLGEGIGVNLRAVNRRCKINDIDNLHIKIAGGETSSTSVMPIGSNLDGTGLAGMISRASLVSTYTTEKTSNNLQINLNMSEIDKRLTDQNIPIRSTNGLSAELNKALEFAFIEQQWNTFKTMPNYVYGLLPPLGVSTELAFEPGFREHPYFTAVCYLATELLVQGIIPQARTTHNAQFLPLWRTLTSVGVGSKDTILGTQSLVRALPQK